MRRYRSICYKTGLDARDDCPDLAFAGGIACLVPARRALGIKPAEALSAD
jgi:hypothetical protein